MILGLNNVYQPGLAVLVDIADDAVRLTLVPYGRKVRDHAVDDLRQAVTLAAAEQHAAVTGCGLDRYNVRRLVAGESTLKGI